ncbi:MAG: hypothetical protein ISS74_03445 [Planctomycetes bacterium]|nr:hypothetical protein [Planctomycetota bacterium]
MRTAVTRPEVPAAIRRRLASLRWSVAVWMATDAVAAFGVLLVIFVAASLLLDRTLRFDRPQRAAVLAIGAAAMGVLAWRRLVRPLGRRLSDDALARAVEARHGELGESLLAAVQLSRLADPEATGASAAMVQASIDQGVRRAAGLDFTDILDRRRRNRNLLVGGGAVALVAAVGLFFPTTMGLWWQRNVLLADVDWPQATHLAILGADDGVLICPRGDDLPVQVRADPDGVVPSVVTLDHRGGGPPGGETMVLVGENLFRTVFRNVLAPFRLRVRGGDDVTPWHDVRLVERPVVDDLVLVYTPPSYVGPEPRTLPANVGSYPILDGSHLEVRGTASKDLEWARLSLGKTDLGDLERVGDRGFRIRLAGDRLTSGVYGVSLMDTTGLASKQPARFSLKVQPDRKPLVRARLEGIGDLIVPRAVVPVQAGMRDDFAISKAELVYRKIVEEGGDETVGRTLFGRNDDLYGGETVEAVHRLDCEPMDLPVGSVLVLTVEATDNDTVSGPKTGTSGVFSLKVVTEDDLRAELLRREQEQRFEFERLLRDQRKLLEDSQALLAILDTPDRPFADEDAKTLAGDEKRQRLVGGRCTAIADQFERILAEVENNRLEEDQTVRDRLARKIIDPLRLMARRSVLAAADLLDQAQKAEPTEAAARRAALAAAAAEQENIVAVMRDVLKNMVKWEGYQEAVTLLREVLRAQKDVSEQTIREYQRRVRSIFEDGEKSGDKP